jgi:hypothetical protein
VKRFAAVPVDPQRLARLAEGGLDLKTLVAEQVQVVVPPEKPAPFASPEAAGVAAGIEVREPAWVPREATLAETFVARPGSFRAQLDTAKLEALARAVGAEEIEIPAFWNGATLDVELPPSLMLRFARPVEAGAPPATEDAIALVQSATPNVLLPEGFDLATLGRLGLRVAGMSAEDALSFSRAIDWRTTLLVPVPVQGGTYREVDVAGERGLLVTFTPPAKPGADGATRRARQHSLLLWSASDKAYALSGPGGGGELLEMAQSVR